jgi:hypothetical protein
MSDAALVLFARAPEPGLVKTRLIPALGAEGACAAHEQLLAHSLRVVGGLGLPAWLYGTGELRRLREPARRAGLRLARQGSGDLGQRMAAAFAGLHARGFERVVLVGSDCPVLDGTYLRQALETLRDVDFVLGPAEDGGYVLLGSARPGIWDPSVLAGVRFGGPDAEADTRAALATLGRVARLAPLWDVDEPTDWARARARALPPDVPTLD